MNKIVSLLIGLAIGGLVGTLLVALFAPISGKALTAELKRGYDETMEEARRASAAKQRELEAEFARMRGR